MRTRQLKPGMKLDHPVVDRLGRNLVARGAELDDYMIDSLLKLGIMSVYIQEGEEEENPEQVPTSPEAEKNIERLRTEDRAKVTLSASIRERVSTGIVPLKAMMPSQLISPHSKPVTNTHSNTAWM